MRASFVEYTKRAGVDPDRAEKDITANEKAIVAILARNHEQAEAFEFQGMPAFIVGRFRMPGVFSAENFKRAVADAGLAAKSKWAAKWTRRGRVARNPLSLLLSIEIVAGECHTGGRNCYAGYLPRSGNG